MRALVPLETYWDQVVVPRVAKQYGVDMVFNPHLTVPIRGRFGKVMVMQTVEYHTVPKVYNWRMYSWWFMLEKLILPAADRVISLSNTMTEDVRKHVNYPITQVRTIYHGVNDKFRVETDCDRLVRACEEVRSARALHLIRRSPVSREEFRDARACLRPPQGLDSSQTDRGRPTSL